MWTFDNPPLKALREKYAFTPTQAWLDHLRLASVRINDGGSGAFVSSEGLVLTNSHIATGQLQKVSSEKKDYQKDGFTARSRSQEIPCPDMEINVLVSMEDVTRRVLASIKQGMSTEQALSARQAEVGKIEKESLDTTGLRSEMVTLYQGGEYWLYRYKNYTDIRLVFAPESSISFFGGDEDNFTYPRHDLDMALLRVYENGKPLNSRDYLKWNSSGAKDGELVFVSGNPGSTGRLKTLAQLETERDFLEPMLLHSLQRLEAALGEYASRGPEEARQAGTSLLEMQNAIKALGGMLQGLRSEATMEQKLKSEEEFKARVAANPDWQRAYGSAWNDIARAEKKTRKMFKLTFNRRLVGGSLPDTAIDLVRYVTETQKPDAERLEEFHEAGLESVRYQILSPAPVYPKLEETLLAASLAESLQALGPGDPWISAALAGKSPAQRAHELISGTKLGDVAFRKSLMEGGAAVVQASNDPLIVLARTVDPIDRATRKQREDQIESIEVKAGEQIGQARFAAYGKSVYPDATFTPRLSYGTVRSYPTNGTQAQPFTTLYGLYDRAFAFNFKPPYDLPGEYIQLKSALDLSTRLNFISSTDVVGGNSGSPVVNRAGELVGLIFDGNIESLLGDFLYDEATNRSIAVHPAAMIHLLRKVYDAAPLADELEGKTAVSVKR